jgi:hypothetical protein
MSILSGIRNIFTPVIAEETPATYNNFYDTMYAASGGSSAPIYSFSFDGSDELTVPTPIIQYTPDHHALALRSWQAYTESEIVQMVLGNMVRWTIGSGLTYRAEPATTVLGAMGIAVEGDEFTKMTEELFKVIKKSNKSVYSQHMNLDQYFAHGELIKNISGDCLYIYRYEGGRFNVQIIDGLNIWSERSEFNGNEVRHGVEINSTGKHIAYWVRVKGKIESQRMPAYGEDGRQYIYMGYGSRYRIDDVRGMPFLSACLATADAITEYRKTTLNSAQERENVAYFAEHAAHSEGEDPLKPGLRQRAQQISVATPGQETGYNGMSVSPATAGNISNTTKKTFINMPVGATLKAVESKNNLYFKEFFRENLGVLCAAAGGQPPEMVLNKFEGSFSSSRMGGEVWNHNKNILIENLITSTYRPFVNLTNESLVRTGQISAPWYREALERGGIAHEAADKNRFMGKSVPHVDPEKEARAERVLLGDAQDNIPLTTLSDSTERLGRGDYEVNIEKATQDFNDAAGVFGISGTNTETTESVQNGETE